LLSLTESNAIEDGSSPGDEHTSGAKTPAYEFGSSLVDLDQELAAMTDAEAEELLLAELEQMDRKGLA